MKVVLFNRQEYAIPDEAGEKLKRALAASSEGFVTLNGDMVRKSAIAMVKAGGYTEAERVQPAPVNRRLTGDKRSFEEQYAAARTRAEHISKIIQEKGIKGLRQ